MIKKTFVFDIRPNGALTSIILKVLSKYRWLHFDCVICYHVIEDNYFIIIFFSIVSIILSVATSLISPL